MTRTTTQTKLISCTAFGDWQHFRLKGRAEEDGGLRGSAHTGALWLSVEMSKDACCHCNQQFILYHQRYRKISRQRRTSCKNTHRRTRTQLHTHMKTMQLVWLTLTPVKYHNTNKWLTQLHIEIKAKSSKTQHMLQWEKSNLQNKTKLIKTKRERPNKNCTGRRKESKRQLGEHASVRLWFSSCCCRCCYTKNKATSAAAPRTEGGTQGKVKDKQSAMHCPALAPPLKPSGAEHTNIIPDWCRRRLSHQCWTSLKEKR